MALIDAPAGECGAAGGGLAAGPGASRGGRDDETARWLLALGAGPVRERARGGRDDETARWLLALGGAGPVRELALARLHGLLLRIARAELGRRAGRHPVTGPELDDLAHQSADDALLAVMAKLGQFRGESRFTTWAYKFVVLEVSSKLGRHFWQRPAVVLDAADWDRLPDRFGISPADHAERQDLMGALRRAVEEG